MILFYVKHPFWAILDIWNFPTKLFKRSLPTRKNIKQKKSDQWIRFSRKDLFQCCQIYSFLLLEFVEQLVIRILFSFFCDSDAELQE